MRSRKALEDPADKRGKAKDTEKEPVSTEKENKQTPKVNEVVEEDKKESYVPPPPYKISIMFPQRFAKEKIEK